MKILQNTLLRNNIISVVQGLAFASILIVLLYTFDFLHIIIVAIIASIGLQSWCPLNPCYADYITSAEAPLASLSLLIAMIITKSVLLSIIITFVILFTYHYFFSFYELYHDVYFTSLLFTIILIFISIYLQQIEVFDDYTIKIFTGIISDTSSFVIIAIIMSLLYVYLSKLQFELRIIGLGQYYSNLLPLHENIIHGISSISRAIISTMVFLLIGWFGALLTTIPFIRNLRPIPCILLFTIIISLLLYTQHVIHPYYIILPIVSIDFLYVFSLSKRLPCSS